MTSQVIPDEAIEAARKALKYYGGIDDSYAARKILKAAAPYLMAQALCDAAEAIGEDPYDDLDPYYAEWLEDRAEKIKEGE